MSACLRGKNVVDTFRYILGIVTGSHLKFGDVEYLKARHIAINGHAHIQIDGDYFGITPVEISIVPNPSGSFFDHPAADHGLPVI